MTHRALLPRGSAQSLRNVSVPSPRGCRIVISDARVILSAFASACLVSVVITAGCGGDDGPDRASVEAGVGAQVREQMPENTAVDNLECVDAGGGKWQCVTYVRSGDEAARVILDVTCDDEARCVFSPGAIAALP